jgi:inorganic pyrophosphatase
MASSSDRLSRLGAYAPHEGELNVIIETPRGCRNKYNYDDRLDLFKLGGVLTAGAVFPFDFGFIPSTLGGDGDPIDVLVLMDESAFPGCLVPSRLVAVIEAEQTERDGRTERNDRLIAVATDSHAHRRVRTLADLGDDLIDEIEHFFISYNQIKGKTFKPLGRFGPTKAAHIVEEGERLFKKRGRKRRLGGKK